MNPKSEIFTEEETIVGYVDTDSGSLLIADGVWETSLVGVSDRNRLVIDVERDNIRIPIIATKQNGRRFLLIPIDAANPIQSNDKDKVDVRDPAEESSNVE
jgi:hypothetical protein